MSQPSNILLIYTGGTIGMVQNVDSKALHPFNFDEMAREIPELNKINCHIQTIAFDVPIDSSDMGINEWNKLGQTIHHNYHDFDGFVILHGTDTMSYTASALSFMLEGLNKPVILTGSQLPIGVLRTDGKENLLTAIEIAGAKHENGLAKVPEVAIYFEYKLLRGNRTHKGSASHFDAFHSPNFRILAEAGVHIDYKNGHLPAHGDGNLQVVPYADQGVFVLPIYPGMLPQMMNEIMVHSQNWAIVLLTYGAGNGPTASWFMEAIKGAIAKNKVVVNVTQCDKGSVNMELYENGKGMLDAGVVSGYDITLESAISKLMYLKSKGLSHKEIKVWFSQPIRGELTI